MRPRGKEEREERSGAAWAVEISIIRSGTAAAVAPRQFPGQKMIRGRVDWEAGLESEGGFYFKNGNFK